MAMHVGGFEDFVLDVAKGLAKGAEGYFDDSLKKNADDAKKSTEDKKKDSTTQPAPAQAASPASTATAKSGGIPQWAVLLFIGYLILKRR